MRRQITIVGILLLTFIFGWLVLQPRYQHFQETKKTIALRQKDLASREAYYSYIESLFERLKGYQEPLDKITSALPPDSNMPALFAFLQKTSSQSGLVLKSIAPLSVRSLEKQGIKESQLAIAVSGSYGALKSFLPELEKSARLIEVKSINFPSPDEENIFNFDVTISVYSY